MEKMKLPNPDNGKRSITCKNENPKLHLIQMWNGLQIAPSLLKFLGDELYKHWSQLNGFTKWDEATA